MSTTYAAVDKSAAQIPMSRLVRVEVRKLFDTRASMALMIAMGAITVAVAVIGYFANAGSYRNGTAQLDGGPLSYSSIFTSMNVPTGIILPVMAILLVTSEWSQRTALATFTMEPRRERIVIAKLIASLLTAVGAIVFSLIVAGLMNVIAGLTLDGAGSWDLTLPEIGQTFLFQVAGLLLGFGFAALFLNTPAAIVAYFVLPVAISVISNLVPWVSDNLAQWIDSGTASAPLVSGDPVSGADWAHFLVAYGIWIGLPMAFGINRILRSEVK